MEKFHLEHNNLSPEDGKAVEYIEQLSSDDYERAEILLVRSGLKKATELDYGKKWAPDEEPQQLSEEEIIQLKTAIEGAGLYMTEPTRSQQQAEEVTEGEEAPYFIAGHDQIRVYISKDKETAERLQKASIYNDGDSRTYGELSGYPKSAVDTYVGVVVEKPDEEKVREKITFRDELPDEIRNQDFMAFVTFELSRDNWQEEIETPRQWAEEIQRIDPELYDRIVLDYKNN